MTSRTCRCAHCKIVYTYHPSGSFHYLNHDRYCPDCYKVILDALKEVPVVRARACRPVDPSISNVTISMFEEAYEEWVKKVMLPFYRLRYQSPENMKYKDLTIKEVVYTLIENTDDGSKLLEMEYEQDATTKELLGPWRDYYHRPGDIM